MLGSRFDATNGDVAKFTSVMSITLYNFILTLVQFLDNL